MTIQSDIANLIVDNNRGLITPQRLRQALQYLVNAHDPAVLLSAIEPGLRKLYIGYAQPWQPGHAYTANELVRRGNQLFVVLSDYTSATGPSGVNIASGLPNAMMADIRAGTLISLGGGGGGGGGAGVNPPADVTKLQDYAFNPTTQAMSWRDARAQMEVVANKLDLNSRTSLPVGNLAVGKLVYVMAEQKLYELIQSPNALTDTYSDWRALGGGGVTYVGRATSLPDPKTTNRPKNGALYVISNDFEGNPLHRLVAWDDTIVGAFQTYNVSSLGFQATDRIVNAAGLSALFTAGPGNEGRWYVVDAPNGLTPQPGEPFAGVTLPLGTKLLDLGNVTRGIRGWQAVSPDPNYIVGGLPTPPAQQIVDDRGLARVRGGWRYLNMKNYINALESDYDHPFDNRKGDFQTTVENNHAVLKVFDGNGWQTLFSEEEIKGWIASLALFRGTASESPANHPGTIALGSLPDLPTLSAAQDKTHTGRYWIWSGQDPFNVIRGTTAAPTRPATGTAAGWTGAGTEPPMSPGQVGHWYDITNLLPGFTGFPYTVANPITVPVPLSDGSTVNFTIAAKTYPDAAATDGGSATAVNGLGWQMMYDGFPAGIQGVMPVVDGGNLYLRVDVLTGAALFPVAVPTGTGTPRIGVDLNGSILHVGDWLVIADRGNGIANDPNEVDLHWVRVGGDLLTKSRGSALFGLNSWAPGGYEQGSLVTRGGDIYKARLAILAGDPAPDAISSYVIPAVGTAVTLQASVANLISTTADLVNFLITQPKPPQWTSYPIRAAFTPTGSNTGFDGVPLALNGAMVWTGLPNMTVANPIDGYDVRNGWMYLAAPPAAAYNPTPQLITAMQQAAQAYKWDKVPIGGAIKFIVDESGLPAAGSVGSSYLILASLTYGGGNPAIVTWDGGSSQWKTVSGGGGGGTALNLTGGAHLINVGVPIGTIIMWADTDIPNGWLVCDGARFDRLANPVLFSILRQDSVPDLRGQFVRGGAVSAPGTTRYSKVGWTTARPRTPFQTDNLGNHKHPIPFNVEAGKPGPSYAAGGYHMGNSETAIAGSHQHTISGGGDAETAPDHVVLTYLIKADDQGLNSRV